MKKYLQLMNCDATVCTSKQAHCCSGRLSVTSYSGNVVNNHETNTVGVLTAFLVHCQLPRACILILLFISFPFLCWSNNTFYTRGVSSYLWTVWLYMGVMLCLPSMLTEAYIVSVHSVQFNTCYVAFNTFPPCHYRPSCFDILIVLHVTLLLCYTFPILFKKKDTFSDVITLPISGIEGLSGNGLSPTVTLHHVWHCTRSQQLQQCWRQFDKITIG